MTRLGDAPAHTGDPEAAHMRERAERYIEACGEYVAPSERERLSKNWEKKADQARGVIEDFRVRATDPSGKRILEIGFGSGVHVAAFARAGAQVAGLEVNPVLKDIAQEYLAQQGVVADLQLYDGDNVPYPDNTFDCIYAISVLEHTSHPRALIHEAARVLKPGGVFYLAFPNRWAPRETHTGFWFLSYLPRGAAAWVLRLFGRNTVEELNLHFVSYPALRRLMRGSGFSVRFEGHRGAAPQRALKGALAGLGMHHSVLRPHIMVVLEKK